MLMTHGAEVGAVLVTAFMLVEIWFVCSVNSLITIISFLCTYFEKQIRRPTHCSLAQLTLLQEPLCELLSSLSVP